VLRSPLRWQCAGLPHRPMRANNSRIENRRPGEVRASLVASRALTNAADCRAIYGLRMLRMRFYLTRPQLSWGVSPRTTDHFVVAARRSDSRPTLRRKEGVLVRRPGRRRPTRAAARRSRQRSVVSRRATDLDTVVTYPQRAHAPRARAPRPCAGREAPRPERSRSSRQVARRAFHRDRVVGYRATSRARPSRRASGHLISILAHPACNHSLHSG